jgi:preprotein translocase subunit SecB
MSQDKKVSENQSNNQIPLAPLLINGQFVKDLSFENPDPLKNLANLQEQPEININVDIKANKVSDNVYEVILHVTSEATIKKQRLFMLELEYAGIFTLNDIPEESIHPILMIECPRLLFPSARSIVANITREGGFPSLSLNPIDFAELYRQQFLKDEQPKSPKEKH